MSITLNTKVYNYRNTANGVTTYAEDSGQHVSGFSLLTAQATLGNVARGQKQAQRSKTIWKLSLPVLADDDTACACAGDVLGTVDFFVEVRSDAIIPKSVLTDGRLRLADLVTNAKFIASVDSHTQPTS